ncbi:MAG: zinc ribbon domain-containing protein [Acidobacteria bacterium]|nr:zinc ribbon domain-containing protein [Acidobacteriota bacterium]
MTKADSRASRSSSAREEFQPWQFFVLAALAAATAAVIVSRGSSATNLIFISAAVLTTAVVGIAAYRTLLPLVAPDRVEGPAMIGGRTRAALEREKQLVLRSIKELEFDRAMRKTSEDDFREMSSRLRARAARLIKALDAEGSGYQALIERELSARLTQSGVAPAPTTEKPTTAPTCAKCGTENDSDARFCKSCGTRLAVSP